jgi:hypothetical protein
MKACCIGCNSPFAWARPSIVVTERFRPPELLKSLPERRDEDQSFRVALGMRHQHADPPHPVRLLRARRKRPRRRPTEKRNDRGFSEPVVLPAADIDDVLLDAFFFDVLATTPSSRLLSSARSLGCNPSPRFSAIEWRERRRRNGSISADLLVSGRL